MFSERLQADAQLRELIRGSIALIQIEIGSERPVVRLIVPAKTDSDVAPGISDVVEPEVQIGEQQAVAVVQRDRNKTLKCAEAVLIADPSAGIV